MANNVYWWNLLGNDYNLAFCTFSDKLMGYEVSPNTRIEDFEEYQFDYGSLGLPKDFEEYKRSMENTEEYKNFSYENLRKNY